MYTDPMSESKQYRPAYDALLSALCSLLNVTELKSEEERCDLNDLTIVLDALVSAMDSNDTGEQYVELCLAILAIAGLVSRRGTFSIPTYLKGKMDAFYKLGVYLRTGWLSKPSGFVRHGPFRRRWPGYARLIADSIRKDKH